MLSRLQNVFDPIGYLLLRLPTLQIICWDICETEMASQRLIGLPKKAFKNGLKNSLFDVQKRGNAAAAAAVTSLKFDDFKSVYQFKSTKELMRSYSILRLCGINFFVDNSLKVSWINSTICHFHLDHIVNPKTYILALLQQSAVTTVIQKFWTIYDYFNQSETVMSV